MRSWFNEGFLSPMVLLRHGLLRRHQAPASAATQACDDIKRPRASAATRKDSCSCCSAAELMSPASASTGPRIFASAPDSLPAATCSSRNAWCCDRQESTCLCYDLPNMNDSRSSCSAADVMLPPTNRSTYKFHFLHDRWKGEIWSRSSDSRRSQKILSRERCQGYRRICPVHGQVEERPLELVGAAEQPKLLRSWSSVRVFAPAP